jgi:hypothetical protein
MTPPPDPEELSVSERPDHRPASHPSQDIRISLETKVDDETAAAYHQLYRATFDELATKAAERQVLHEHEFLADMADPRVHKYVARDGTGRVVGMSSVTAHLETVPWINPEFFAHRFPGHAERGAIYYLGFTLVDARVRQSRVFAAMVDRIVEMLVAERAVCTWDICAHNDGHGLGRNIDRIVRRTADVEIAPVDRQTYYAATFSGRPAVRDPR